MEVYIFAFCYLLTLGLIYDLLLRYTASKSKVKKLESEIVGLNDRVSILENKVGM